MINAERSAFSLKSSFLGWKEEKKGESEREMGVENEENGIFFSSRQKIFTRGVSTPKDPRFHWLHSFVLTESMKLPTRRIKLLRDKSFFFDKKVFLYSLVSLPQPLSSQKLQPLARVLNYTGTHFTRNEISEF